MHFKIDSIEKAHHQTKISHKNYHDRYVRKVNQIGRAISEIGALEFHKPPTLIGLAEVENAEILKDLIKSSPILKYNYGFVHFDSPDKRGMDVALLYDKDCFHVIDSKSISLHIFDEFGVRNPTRDILLVSGKLKNEKMYILVNHWPSRHVTSDKSGQQRMLAAQKVVELIEDIRQENINAKIIVMGDFNDTPKNDSLQYLIKSSDLHNPMAELQSYTRGSFNHHSKWMLFDQIILSKNFLSTEQPGCRLVKADIFDAEFLKQTYGKSKNHPFMTFTGKRYMGGYSDHFPVYIQLKDENY